jgi:hypothetical protein
MNRSIKTRLLLIAGLCAVLALVSVLVFTGPWSRGGGTEAGDASLSASSVQQNDSVTALDTAGFPSAPPAVSQQQEGPPATLDETFAAVAETAPGFGGLFFDDAGAPTIYVQDTAQADAAEAAVRETLGDEIGEAPINVLVGQYDFDQLSTWYDAMDILFDIPALVFTDIDESKNKLTVGLEDLAVEAEVRAELDVLGVPQAAVNIVQAQQPVLLTDPPPAQNDTLRSMVRPLAGGLRILDNRHVINMQPKTDGDYCTLGFIAIDSAGKKGFVTAAHCTPASFDSPAKPGTRHPIFQPKADKIGEENLDPGLFDCKTPPPQCRWSDSAFIEIVGNVTSALGKIKRPTAPNDPPAQDQNPKFVAGDFVIVDTSNFPIMNQSISKVGQKTGWTEGRVTRTCFKHRSASRNLLCQFASDVFSNIGDSGSPIFQILDDPIPGPNQQVRVRLKGLLWGGPNNPDGTPNKSITFFSPLAGVFQDLGLTPQSVIVPNPPAPPKLPGVLPPSTAATPPKTQANPCATQPTPVGGPVMFDVTAAFPHVPKEGAVSEVCFQIVGTGGSVGAPVTVKVNAAGCPDPLKLTGGANLIHVDWGTKCVLPKDVVTVTASAALLPTAATAFWMNGGVVIAKTEATVSEQPPPAVGGISRDVDAGSLPAASESSVNDTALLAVIAGVTSAAIALAGGIWCVRRRRVLRPTHLGGQR